MTEEQLEAAGWLTEEDVTLPRGWRFQKQIGNTLACLYWNVARACWQAWAVRKHPLVPDIEALSLFYGFGTVEEAITHAEQQARTIEAWLAGDPCGALERAR